MRSGEHHLTTGDRYRLTGFISLAHRVDDRPGHIRGEAAAPHRHQTLVVTAHIGDVFGARNFSGRQILDKESAFRIAPQRAVEEVPRADRVDLDPVGNEFKRKTLNQSDASEFTPCVSSVVLRTDQPALAVDLDDVAPTPGNPVLHRHEPGEVLAAEEEADIVDVSDKFPVPKRKLLDRTRSRHSGIRDQQVASTVTARAGSVNPMISAEI